LVVLGASAFSKDNLAVSSFLIFYTTVASSLEVSLLFKTALLA